MLPPNLSGGCVTYNSENTTKEKLKTAIEQLGFTVEALPVDKGTSNKK